MREGSDRTVMHSIPAYDAAANVTVTFPVVDGIEMIARTAAPPNVSGSSGPRRLVTKVWTTRW